jgi:hypothetical protein
MPVRGVVALLAAPVARSATTRGRTTMVGLRPTGAASNAPTQ